MTFVESVKTCFKKYADFSGRATRSEFWWFYLAYLLAYIALAFLSGILAGVTGNGAVAMIAILPILGFILPMLAVNVRRNHDSDKSGWWLLVPFYNLYLLVIQGTPGDNRFGPPPAN